MVPESKVSVPFDVVILTIFKTPESATEPPAMEIAVEESPPKTPVAHHVFPVTLVMTNEPPYSVVADDVLKPKPVVKYAPVTVDVPLMPPPTYPDVTGVPDTPS